MPLTGDLRKMQAEPGSPLRYFLELGGERLDLNAQIGQELRLRYTGTIHCRVCGRKTKKAYGEGFCFPHFQSHPDNSPCILRPELCEGHLGKGRDPEWEAANHVQPHVVYLALSGGLKVGITRLTQVPTRWIDQGASAALPIAATPNRYLAGMVEVALKAHVSDKTAWQQMLRDQQPEADLAAERERLCALLPPDLAAYCHREGEITQLHYPVRSYPEKPRNLSLDKEPEIQGLLEGIRGQYLLFAGGGALNVRSHTGYEVEWGL
jgi:hypothetical protein